MLAGFHTSDALTIEMPEALDDKKEEELMQKELYWSMKEMKRYNNLRGAFPTRPDAEHPSETPNSTIHEDDCL